MTQRGIAGLLVAGVLSVSCAYYNGLYNANRLAADAARARREGRGGESRSLWEQAAVKAESVAVRFPHSRYRDDALLLQGRALLESDHCAAAVPPLVLASDSSPDDPTRRHARLLLGECRVRLGDPGAARAALDPLVAAPDSVVAQQARIWRARAALGQADYATALADLTGAPDSAAALDRAAALLGLGRPGAAAQALLVAAPGRYDERRWPAVLESLGQSDPAAASALVDSLFRRGNLSAGQHARLLLADAARWHRAGSPFARTRLLQAREMAADSVEGRLATAHLLLEELRTLRDPSRLEDLHGRIIQADETEGSAVLSPAVTIIRGLIQPESGDLAEGARFLAIEAVRDSLEAPLLAAALFRDFERDHPASPLAPKALLAAAMLDPDSAAITLELVRTRYPDSPYLAAARGESPAGFTAAEETIRRGNDSVMAPAARPAPRGVTPDRPSTGRRLPEP